MSSSNGYVKLHYNDYGYEIYIITDSKSYKLGKQNKIIMRGVLDNFSCKKINEDTFIFPNYKLITLYFSKEKLKNKFKKVNRMKSRKVVASILLIATLIGAGHVVGGNINSNKENKIQKNSGMYEQEMDEFDDVDMIIENIEEILNNFEHESIKPTLGEFIDLGNEHNKSENVQSSQKVEIKNEFWYECEEPNDKAALTNSEQYMEVFSKYEKIYGVDAKLLCAIGAQESSGIHHKQSINGGYATGLMGIENIWANGEIRVFNFETNCYETIVVDYSRIGELDYNIKIGAAIFQNYFYGTLRNVDSIEDTDYLAFTVQKYNMGPGNMNKVLAYGDNWVDNRQMINAGDKHYFEHVLSRLDNDTVISIRLDDGSYYDTKIVNMSLDRHYGRI